MSKLHDFMKNREASVTSVVDGKTIIDYFNQNADEFPDYPALNTPINDEYSGWDSTSWSEYREQVHNLAAGLIDIGFSQGDNGFIVSDNTKEHFISDLSIMHAGGTPSTIYKQLKGGQIAYISNLLDAKIAFVGNSELFEEVNKAKKECKNLEYIILIEDYEQHKDLDYVLNFQEIIENGKRLNESDSSKLENAIASVTPQSLACLIFTSGTTGNPKGVMITHENVLWTAQSLFAETVQLSTNPRIVSYLPMAHIAARLGDHYQSIYRRGQIFPVPVLEDMAKALPTIKPSIFLAVPRVWERFQSGLLNKINESDKKDLALKAIDNGLERVEYEQRGETPPLGVRIKDAIFNKLVFERSFKVGLGLDNSEVFITAAAPMNPDVQKWFHAIHIDVAEVYGMTEDTGPATFCVPSFANSYFNSLLKSNNLPIPDVMNPIGKVGMPIMGTEIKVLDDGELCIRGKHVAKGYYKAEEETKATFDEDGWLHTGDLAEIDENGFAKIIGRKKEIIITSGGKNIAPVELENLIKTHDLIGQICMVGDGKKFLSALIVLDGDGGAEKWAEENGVEYNISDMSKNSKVIDAIQGQIDEANSKVARVQQIKKFTLLENEWTDSSGELTPTLKLKRNVIAERYKNEIESMYEEV
ncbi:MAG: long-chain acyl-CoA synthetase [Actinomycetota bacterium]|nr:MAG: long-chain acyl-CoA synthetase [Actinomycetota bacterium]